ncbi:MAG: tRNA (adenosine(37)-N6)-dimethylallyltransferase MiaA [Deltaproteobacteria bacterium]|nr:tRNA (adenosine(37)-N6)-dimethylallyltransferase MiaA [Deltaproteobacteria bacterium]
MDKIKVVAIVGPTASGKSMLAMELAERFNVEIVSADSMQVYRSMDIGTAKPTKEQRSKIKHHMIDVANPDEEFTAARYKDEASKAIHGAHARGKNVFVVGGTGLYIRALTKGLFNGPGSDMRLRNGFAMLANYHAQIGSDGKRYLHDKLKEVDAESASKIHPHNTARIVRAMEVYYLTSQPISLLQKEHGFLEEPYQVIKIGLSVDRETLYKKIEERVDRMIEAGMVDEVRRLLANGYSSKLKAMGGLGYKEITEHIQNKCSLEDAIKEIKRNTRRYAKRQMTWFKKEADIRWFSCEEKDRIITLVEGFLHEQAVRN